MHLLNRSSVAELVIVATSNSGPPLIALCCHALTSIMKGARQERAEH